MLIVSTLKIFERDDFMYFDPGFGGMLLQVLLAIIAMSGAIVFSFRKRIRNFFSKFKSKDVVPDMNIPDNEDDAYDVLGNDKN